MQLPQLKPGTKREEVTVYEKEREDKRISKQRTVLGIKPNDPPNGS